MFMGKVILILTVFTLVIYFGICFLLYKHQKSMIFHPEALPHDHKFSFPYSFEEVDLNHGKQVRLNAIFAKTESPNKKGVILYHHGNAGNLNSWGNVAPDFLKLGYDILIPDYRGYGKSTGKLSEQMLTKDAQQFYEYLKERYSEDQIVLYGRSLGTGVTTNLARSVRCKMVILETPFLSVPDMAAEMLPPVLPIRQLLSYKLDNADNLSNIQAPVYLIHGTEDELVPYRHSEGLVNVLKQPEVLYTIEGAGHNNISEFPVYHEVIAKLLD